MARYRGNWGLAESELEAWRLYRAEQRPERNLRKEKRQDFLEDPASSEAMTEHRFRWLNPLKHAVEPFLIVFVNQSALIFGSDAIPPRTRRPLFILRFEQVSGRYLGAPLTSKYGFRKFHIEPGTDGFEWLGDQPERSMYLYQIAEYVSARDVHPISPLARVSDPLLKKVISFIRISTVNKDYRPR